MTCTTVREGLTAVPGKCGGKSCLLTPGGDTFTDSVKHDHFMSLCNCEEARITRGGLTCRTVPANKEPQ